MRNGLKICRPTGSPAIVVAGSGSQTATIVGHGSVEFANASSLSLNNVFTSEFDNYMIVFRGVSTLNENIGVRMRLSGTNNETTTYTKQQLFANGTSVSGQRLSGVNYTYAWSGYASSAQRSGFTLYLYGPSLAQPTAGRGVTAAGLSNASIVDYAWTHSVSTAYDGITIFPTTTGLFAGLVSVYGLVD